MQIAGMIFQTHSRFP
ncbi:hypothetical protein [Blautia glucerasea]